MFDAIRNFFFFIIIIVIVVVVVVDGGGGGGGSFTDAVLQQHWLANMTAIFISSF